METKNCTKCTFTKGIENFSKNKSAKDGLQAWCKDCQRAYAASRKALKAPLSAFEGIVGGLSLQTSKALLDVVCGELTIDQQEALKALLLALAEDQLGNFFDLLGLITTTPQEIATVFLELLFYIHACSDLQQDEQYKTFLRRTVLSQFT